MNLNSKLASLCPTSNDFSLPLSLCLSFSLSFMQQSDPPNTHHDEVGLTAGNGSNASGGESVTHQSDPRSTTDHDEVNPIGSGSNVGRAEFLVQVDGWSSKNNNKRGGITELSERDKMAPLMKSLNDDGKEEISMLFTDNGTHAVSVDQGNRCAATTHGIICAMHVLDGLKKQESGPSS
jgi:hypothetical protein